ncbi:MAG: radical SAM/SPASM domain-containing protein [Candidatus Aminicenantia bacterium]
MRRIEYYKALLKIFFNYKMKRFFLSSLPVRLWIEPVSTCNLKCVMCPNKDLPENDRGLMEFDLYKKIIDEAKDFVSEVNLYHRGESLLHPQLKEFILYSVDNGIYTKIHTNGTLLENETIEKILDSRLHRITFSYDAYDKETYEKIRVGANYETVMENIKNLLKKKKERRSHLAVFVELIAFPNMSWKEIRKKRKELSLNFAGLPLNGIITRRIHNWGGYLNIRKSSNKYTICPFPWNALIIFWDGSVVPCTQDFFGDYKIGNVKEFKIKELWNNEKMMNLRKLLSEGKYSEVKICENCDRPWRKRFFGVPTEYLWEFITKRMP